MLRYALPLCLLLACTDDPTTARDMTSGTPDMPRDMPRDVSTTPVDQGASDQTPDLPKDQAPDLPEDQGPEVDQPQDMVPDQDPPQDQTPDLEPDQGPDYSARPKGMCTQTSACGGALTCTRSAAGGTCQGCGQDNDCDSIQGDGTYTCVFGACVRDCSTSDECAPGRRCDRRGRCAIERCSAGVCPTPWFVCSAPDGLCERASCNAGQACPLNTTCSGGVCLEDHANP